MRFWLISLISMLCSMSIGQQAHPFLSSDTIKANHRIGGELDSIDQMFRSNSSTLPGGNTGFSDNLLQSDWSRTNPNGQRFFSFSNWSSFRYSGIPHIGFAYSFGSQGTQMVKTEYEQGFRGNVMLNVDFVKDRSTGYLRNGNYDHNDVKLKLFKKGAVYSLELKSSFQKSTVSQNGGISADSLADEFSLIFIPVNKEIGELNTQRSRIELINYFDLLKDSTVAMGLYTSHDLRIKKYRYLESGALTSVYPIINFDSTSTYDQHQWSQFGNGSGVFFKKGRQYLSAGVTAQFWNFQNLGFYKDTLELDLVGKYQWISKNFRLTEDLSANIIGAQQELQNDLHIWYKINNVVLKGEVYYQNSLPDYYQRYGTGNNYFPVQNIGKQQLTDLSIGGEYTAGKHLLKLNYKYTGTKDNYWFMDSIWRNDTLSTLKFQSIKVASEHQLGLWSIQPEYRLTLNEKNLNIIPTHQFRARILVKGGVFKAKKMITYGGLDLCAYSSFSRVGWNAVNSTMRLNDISAVNTGWSNVHVFGGFQIEEFKFYLRVENFGYFWNDRNVELMNGFPIPYLQFRLGLTWDFFN